MKRAITTLLAIILTLGIFTPAALAGGWSFTDVGEGHWARDATRFVYDEGIMRGTSETTFSPNQDFSREMSVATLFRLYHERGASDSDPTTHPFTDVSGWATPYIAWAFESGLVTGTDATTFAPTAPISRQDFAVMLYRFAAFIEADTSSPSGYTDVFRDAHLVGSWAEEAVNWAVYHRVPHNNIWLYLRPRETVVRAQAAIWIERFVVLITHPPEPLPPLCPELEARIKHDWVETMIQIEHPFVSHVFVPRIAVYLGTYNGNVVLKMAHTGLIISNDGWSEEVAGRRFFYWFDQRVLVWNDGVFYTLSGTLDMFRIWEEIPSACKLGLLSEEDVRSIHFRFQHWRFRH